MKFRSSEDILEKMGYGFELLSVFYSVSIQTIFAMAFACEYFLHFFDGMDDKWCSKYHCSVLEPPFLYPPDRQT